LKHIDSTYDPSFLKDIAMEFGKAFMPPYSLAAVTPMMEIWANKTFHTGQAIEPEYMRSTLPAEYRAYPYTTEASKAISHGVSSLLHKFGVSAGVSPIVIDHFIRAQFGGLGASAWKFHSAGLSVLGVLPSIQKSPLGSPSDLPFVSRFAVRFPSATMQSSQDFIDMYATYDAKVSAIKDAMKPGALVTMDEAIAEEERGGQQLRNFYAFHSNPHPAYGVSLTDIKDTIGQVRGIMQAVYNNKGEEFTSHQKKDIINEAYFTIAELSKIGTKIINSGVDHVDSRPGVPDAEQIGQ
jgi:hypothetical protein